MNAALYANHAKVLEAQIKLLAGQIGVELSADAFSEHYSADVPVAISARISLAHRVTSTMIAGEKPKGKLVATSSEANTYLNGIARQRIDADALVRDVRSKASPLAKKILSSGTATAGLGAFSEQASTVQACGNCRDGSVTCSSCKGGGVFVCAACDGRGQVTKQCSNCGGHGKLKCHTCHGAGNVTNTYQVLSMDGTRYNAEQRYERCSSCNGSGFDHFPCAPCSGRGTISVKCEKCSGTGKIVCSKCSGKGSLTCDTCKGHKKTTTVYEAEPYITAAHGSLHAAIQGTEKLIASNVKLLTDDPHFAPSLTKFSGSKSEFAAEYQDTVPIGAIAVTAAGKKFQLHAIGRSLMWTSQPRIADALLGGLLTTLKATRSAGFEEIPALTGNSDLGKALADGGMAGKNKFAGKLLPGLSREMADQLQAEVTRLYRSARRARLTRRAIIAAPFVIAGAIYGGWGWLSAFEAQRKSLSNEPVKSYLPGKSLALSNLCVGFSKALRRKHFLVL